MRSSKFAHMDPTDTHTDVPPDDQELSQDSLYGYVPTEYVCIMFISLFAVSTGMCFIEQTCFRASSAEEALVSHTCRGELLLAHQVAAPYSLFRGRHGGAGMGRPPLVQYLAAEQGSLHHAVSVHLPYTAVRPDHLLDCLSQSSRPRRSSVLCSYCLSGSPNVWGAVWQALATVVCSHIPHLRESSCVFSYRKA